MKIELWDTFNNVKISSHLSIRAAIKKQQKHLRNLRKYNGRDCFLTYAYRYSDGTPVDQEDIFANVENS